MRVDEGSQSRAIHKCLAEPVAVDGLDKASRGEIRARFEFVSDVGTHS